MKIYKLLSFLLLSGVVFGVSCTKNEESKTNVKAIKVAVDKNVRDVSVSDFSRYSIVALETSDSAYFGRIEDIHLINNNVYISDKAALYCFDSLGTFKGKINRFGPGPEEYQEISDFQVDTDGNAWVLSRSSRSLNLYSWHDNSLLKQIKLDYWIENIRMMNDTTMVLYAGNERGYDSNYQLYELNLTSNKITKHYKPIDAAQSKYLFIMGHNYFSQEKSFSPILFCQNFNDTVYSIDNNGCKPLYYFDLGSKNIPRSFFDSQYKDIMDFFTKLYKENYAYGLNFISESEGSYWFSYYYEKKCYWGNVLKSDNQEQMIFDSFSMDESLGNYKVDLNECECYIQDGGKVIIPLSVADIVEYAESHSVSVEKIKATINYTSDEQNPILLLVELKK